MTIQLRALLLSLLALCVPVLAAFLVPEEFADYEALLWLVALVPAFLFAYQRGWKGAALALALGMATLSLTYAAKEILDQQPPDILAPVVVALILLTVGIGIMAEGLHRRADSQSAGPQLVDPETGLPTWEYASAYIEREWDAATRGRSLVVVLFEMDDPAEYAQRLGEGAKADAVVRFARVLERNTRRMNVSARMPDGECRFLTVLSGSDVEGAGIFARRVLDVFRTEDGDLTSPTVSAGVAEYRPGMSAPDRLVAVAGRACRRARKDGGDRVRVRGLGDVDVSDGEGAEEGTEPEPDRELVPTCLLVWKGNGAGELEESLQESLHVESVPDVHSAQRLVDRDYDLLILDLQLDGSLELVEVLRARKRATPILALVPADELERGLTAMNRGIDRCLVVPCEEGEIRREAAALAPRRWKELERSRLEAELRAQHREVSRTLERTQARYEDVVEQIREVVFRLDADGRIQLLNAAWERITGHGREESLGRPLIDFVTADDHEEWRELLERLRAGDASEGRAHLRIQSQEDSPVWIELTASARRNERTGELLDISGTMIDVTQRRQLEEELNQRQRMEAVGRLAGGIAHDFNNVLTSIRGNTELIELDLGDADRDPSRAVEYVEEIKAASSQAARLIRRLLVFSHGRTDVEAEVQDLNEVLSDLGSMLKRLVPAGVKFEMALSGVELPVECKPGEIDQIVVNLVVNALDAMSEGGDLGLRLRRVEVGDGDAELHPDLNPGPHAQIEVSDTGHGIDPAIRKKIFEPFFTTRESGKGTGLGLATVYAVVHRMNGSVSVDSEVGRGARFTVLLPLSSSRA